MLWDMTSIQGWHLIEITEDWTWNLAIRLILKSLAKVPKTNSKARVGIRDIIKNERTEFTSPK